MASIGPRTATLRQSVKVPFSPSSWTEKQRAVLCFHNANTQRLGGPSKNALALGTDYPMHVRCLCSKESPCLLKCGNVKKYAQERMQALAE